MGLQFFLTHVYTGIRTLLSWGSNQFEYEALNMPTEKEEEEEEEEQVPTSLCLRL